MKRVHSLSLCVCIAACSILSGNFEHFFDLKGPARPLEQHGDLGCPFFRDGLASMQICKYLHIMSEDPDSPDFLQSLGVSALGSRLRRLFETLNGAVTDLYRAELEFEQRWFR